MEGIVILAVTFGLMWVFFILPRQRQLRAHQALVASLAPGDRIITGGGIYGTIVADEGDVVVVEIADGVTIRVARAAVLRRTDEPATALPVDDPERVEPDAG